MSLPDHLYVALTSDDEGRLCKDIPDAACRHQPNNFTTHVLSLAATKAGDGLADPKLVLAWLLGALGATETAIGLLVPVREAFALLPQLFTSAYIRSLPLRKWAWAAGSVVQGLCVLAMALVALSLKGATAGWAIVGLLCIFATARSVCSVSYKDVLGKTVSKQARGTATGSASSFAAVVVLLFGIILTLGWLPLTPQAVAVVLAIAGGLWVLSGITFSRIVEEPGATEGGANALPRAIEQFSLLKRDRQLVRFIAVRGLLTATALAPPFLITLAGASSDDGIESLGVFIIASSFASAVSSYVWGRLSDKSSRSVLIMSALSGMMVLGAVVALALLFPAAANLNLMIAGALFVLLIAYQGVRLGRSTHLVDMTDEEKRASYTALSNTIIGLVLMVGGVFGGVAAWFGVPVVLALFSAMCGLACLLALGLEEVQQQGRS